MKSSTTGNKVDKINTGIVTSCVVGLALSYYAYIVEITTEQDQSYEAFCDISEHISCTKAFMSEYGKGFGIIPENSIFYLPNSLYGLGFYGIVILISIFNSYFHAVTLVSLAVLSNIGSVYLAWILYQINDICVICISTYIINGIILVLSYNKLQILLTFQMSSANKGTIKKKRH